MRSWLILVVVLFGCADRGLVAGPGGDASGGVDAGSSVDLAQEASVLDLAAANVVPEMRTISYAQPPDLGAGAALVLAPVSVSAGPLVSTIAVGDVDGDGVDDLVTANVNDFVGNGRSVGYHRSNGDGSFAPQVKYAAPDGPHFVSLADLDHDGQLDLAVGANASVGIRLHTSAPFGSATEYANSGGGWLCVADVDGDGVLDLVYSEFPANVISVRRGRGDGSFDLATSLSLGTGIVGWLGTGDFDEDGRADVAYLTQDSRLFGVALGNAAGGLVDGGFFAVPGSPQPTGLTVGDLDGDGHADVVISSFYPWQVSVLLGDGQGWFRSMSSYLAGPTPGATAIGDFDGDGLADLMVASNKDERATLWFLAGAGGGWLSSAQLLKEEIGGSYGITAGDFDHDGRLDLAEGLRESLTVHFNRTP